MEVNLDENNVRECDCECDSESIISNYMYPYVRDERLQPNVGAAEPHGLGMASACGRRGPTVCTKLLRGTLFNQTSLGPAMTLCLSTMWR